MEKIRRAPKAAVRKDLDAKQANKAPAQAPKKERAHDKKKKLAVQGEEACKAALRRRAFKCAEEVFVVLLPDEAEREISALSVRESIKALKLPAAVLADMFKGLGWDKKPSRRISGFEFVQVFAWAADKDVGEGVMKAPGHEGGAGESSVDRSEEDVENAIDATVRRRRDVAAAVRKRIGDAEKMLKKKVSDPVHAHPPF